MQGPVNKCGGQVRKEAHRKTGRGVARNVRESHLQQMMSTSNVGFQHVHLYTSCTCRPCLDPMMQLTHPRGCICVNCGDPGSHRSWAVFVFGNQLAAEYGMAEIKYQVLRTLPQLCWTPRSLSIQHPDAQLLLSHEERRLRLKELNAVIAAGNARLPPGEAEKPPPPPPLLELPAEEVADEIGESGNLLKPGDDATRGPAINETATTAASPPDPSAAASSGGDGDMLLPDFGGSECDSADILAGYASSPVTFRRKQPPKSPREEASKKRKAADMEPKPAASSAAEATVGSSLQQSSTRQQTTEAPNGSHEPGQSADASAASQKKAHCPESPPQLGTGTGHKTAERGSPQKKWLKSILHQLLSSNSPGKGVNSRLEAAVSPSALQPLAQSMIERSKQQQSKKPKLPAAQKPQQGVVQPPKQIPQKAKERPQQCLSQPPKQTPQKVKERPQQSLVQPPKQTPQKAKERDKAAAGSKSAAKNGKEKDRPPKGITAAKKGTGGGGHAAPQHPVPGSSKGGHRPSHSRKLFKQAAGNSLKGAKDGFKVLKSRAPPGKQQQKPRKTHFLIVNGHVAGSSPQPAGSTAPQAGRQTKAPKMREQTPKKSSAEAAPKGQQQSGSQRNGKAAASQQPGDGNGPGNNGNAAAPQSLASLLRKRHTGKFAPALDRALPPPPPADAGRPSSSTAAAPALPPGALTLALIPAAAPPPPPSLIPQESQLVVYSPSKLAARLEATSPMESGESPPNKSHSKQVKHLPPSLCIL